MTVPVQRVMEHRQHHFLRLGVQIDQQVPAGDQVEFGKRRILEHVLLGEHHHVADVLVDTVELSSFLKKRSSRSAEMSAAILSRYSPARAFSIEFIDVGRDDIDRHAPSVRSPNVPDQDRDRVHLLAGRAADHPDAEGCPGRPRSMRDDDLIAKRLERRRVAEETGDSDQQFPEERVQLQRGLPQLTHVVARLLDLGDEPSSAARFRRRRVLGL